MGSSPGSTNSTHWASAEFPWASDSYCETCDSWVTWSLLTQGLTPAMCLIKGSLLRRGLPLWLSW